MKRMEIITHVKRIVKWEEPSTKIVYSFNAAVHYFIFKLRNIITAIMFY